ncbi:ATP-binding protein [Caulobacter sp. ErkDOM-YI]|uniref:hybrid sensor histidine kinase/response regulator n=1 Tax=unclassified Caulobacter TaxID=2648921 RepID=UPI003AF5E973
MKRTSSRPLQVWPLTVLAMTAIVLLAVSLVLGARQVDLRVRRHEEFLVRQGIRAEAQQTLNALIAQTVWDDAVVNLDNRLNPTWANDQIATYLQQSIGPWNFVLVDSDDKAVWGSGHTAPLSAKDLAELRHRAEPIIAEIRQQEAARSAAPGGPVMADNRPQKAIVTSQVEMRDGRPYLWIASLVQPDFGKAKPAKAKAAIVIGGDFLARTRMDLLAQRYKLQQFRFEPGGGKVGPDEASTTFASYPGAIPVALVWRPERPGADLLQQSLWMICGVVVVLAALAGLMSYSTRRAARSLLENHHAQAEFLANMSHELRTPLNGVNALSEALAKTALTASQREMADTIHKSGQMLSRLLSDILDLARIDAKGLSLEPEPFLLSGAVKSIADIMAPRAREKGLELQLDLDPAAEVWVLGDTVRLAQVLTNLLSNAIKFTEQGHIRLSVRAASDDAAGGWRFTVQDTGVGFEPSQQDAIFKRFQQADGSVTRRFGGTGLGLAISRELAEMMGGRLTAEGRPGDGAVFRLDMPLPETDARPSQFDPHNVTPDAEIAEEHAATRVLVSEDHPINRLVIETLLSELGMTVLSTENGLEACEAFESQEFDLILMDMQMPVMDGLTAIRRMRRYEIDRGRTPTPIIMITANALPEHRAAGMEAGADIFITKPLSANTFFGAVSTLRTPA